MNPQSPTVHGSALIIARTPTRPVPAGRLAMAMNQLTLLIWSVLNPPVRCVSPGS
jgi:hypothetical protein